MARTTLMALLLLGLQALALPGLALGQDTEAPAEVELTTQAVEKRLAELSEATLDPETKDSATAYYRQALEFLRLAGEAGARATEFERLSAAAPGLLTAIREELARPPTDTKASSLDMSLEFLEQKLRVAEAGLTAARENAEQLRVESTRRTERQTALTEPVARVRQRLSELTESLKAPPLPDQNPALVRARRTLLLAEQKSQAAELRAHELELQSYDARGHLLPARKDRAQRRVAEAEARVSALQEAVARKRRLDAEAAAAEAERRRRETARNTPELSRLAEENQALARRRTGAETVGKQIRAAEGDLDLVRGRLDQLRSQFHALRSREQAAGLTDAMGLLLRKQYQDLPTREELRRRTRKTRNQVSETELRLILLEEQRSQAGAERMVQEVVAALAVDREGRDLQLLEDEARRLFAERRDLLDSLVKDSQLHFKRSVDLDTATRDLDAATEEYRTYVERRILWIPSVAGSLGPERAWTSQALRALLSREGWQSTFAASWGLWSERRGAMAGGLGALLLLLVAAALSIRRLRRPPQEISFRRTLRKFFLSALAASFPGAVLEGLGWVLTQSGTDLGRAVGHGLSNTAFLVFALAFMWGILRRDGLGGEFRWSTAAMEHLRWHLTWFAPLRVAAVALVFTLEELNAGAWSNSLGRGVFVLTSLVLSLVVYLWFRPASPVFARAAARDEGSWHYRLRRLWFPLLLVTPLVLGGMAVAGYFYTAVRLEECVRASLALVFGLFVAHGMLMRWLLLARRKLARRVATASAPPSPPSEELTTLAPAPSAPLAEVPGSLVEQEAGLGPDSLSALSRDAVSSAPTPPPSDEAQSGESSQADESSQSGEASQAGESSQAGEASQAGEPAAVSPETPPEPALKSTATTSTEAADLLDLAALRAQAGQLVNSAVAVLLVLGLSWAWSDVLPALRRLDQVQLFPHFEIVELTGETFPTLEQTAAAQRPPSAPTGPAPAAEGAASSAQKAPPQPSLPGVPMIPSQPPAADVSSPADNRVTLANLGLAILVLIGTFLVSKNLPAVMDIALVGRVPLDAGARYALVTVTRYIVGGVGLTVAFKNLGIGWSSVQWLAAALTFGLAFGLQEIFANFVSGLILLAERPIRVGDVVTVNGINGKVSRIRTRATTIAQWNGRELILPNKNFVTGEVINWTLSETKVRVDIPVGVSYDSDDALAKRLLVQAAREHPIVLNDPEPSAYFVGFGASALDFELRAWIPDPEYLPQVREDLLQAVRKSYREAKLEIAFPQRDLHLRSGKLTVQLEGGQPPAPGGDSA